MMQDISDTIAYLTKDVADARHKPALRPVMESELMRSGYSADTVQDALDKFYKVNTQ